MSPYIWDASVLFSANVFGSGFGDPIWVADSGPVQIKNSNQWRTIRIHRTAKTATLDTAFCCNRFRQNGSSNSKFSTSMHERCLIDSSFLDSSFVNGCFVDGCFIHSSFIDGSITYMVGAWRAKMGAKTPGPLLFYQWLFYRWLFIDGCFIDGSFMDGPQSQNISRPLGWQDRAPASANPAS